MQNGGKAGRFYVTISKMGILSDTDGPGTRWFLVPEVVDLWGKVPGGLWMFLVPGNHLKKAYFPVNRKL